MTASLTILMILMILMLTIIIFQTHWCIVEDSWLPRGPILLEKIFAYDFN